MKTVEDLQKYIADYVPNMAPSIRVRRHSPGDDNVFCIERIGFQWVTFYYERGFFNDLRVFKNERAAVEYFYSLINEYKDQY